MGGSQSSAPMFDQAHPFCVQAVPASTDSATPAAVYCRGANFGEALATATAANRMCTSFNSRAGTGDTTDGAYACPSFARFDGTAAPNLAPLNIGKGVTAKTQYPLAGLSTSTQYMNVTAAPASGDKPMDLFLVPSGMTCAAPKGSKDTAMQFKFGDDNYCNFRPSKKS